MPRIDIPIARPDTIRKAIQAAEDLRGEYTSKLKNHGQVREFREANERCIQRLKQLRN